MSLLKLLFIHIWTLSASNIKYFGRDSQITLFGFSFRTGSSRTSYLAFEFYFYFCYLILWAYMSIFFLSLSFLSCYFFSSFYLSSSYFCFFYLSFYIWSWIIKEVPDFFLCNRSCQLWELFVIRCMWMMEKIARFMKELTLGNCNYEWIL